MQAEALGQKKASEGLQSAVNMLSTFNPSDDVTDASRVVFLFVDADSADSICELIPNIPDNIDIYALRIGLDVILFDK